MRFQTSDRLTHVPIGGKEGIFTDFLNKRDAYARALKRAPDTDLGYTPWSNYRKATLLPVQHAP